MPKLTINGLEIEHSGNLIDALMSHPRTAELSDTDIAMRLGRAIIPENPGFTYNDVMYTYAGISGSVINSNTDYQNVIHTDYAVWEHDNGDGTWAIIYSDGNWWVSGTTAHEPSTWTHRFNPEISNTVMIHWWGNDAHTVDPASNKYGPRDGVTWS
jgi:hypothetical protein